MKSNIFISKKCKVGFNPRSDTYTGKLGYVIYHDGKVWRKEASWESWRYSYISPEEFDRLKYESFTAIVKNCTDSFNRLKGTPKPTGWTYDWERVNKWNTLEEYLSDYGCDSIDKYSFNVRGKSPDITINPIEFDNEPLEGFVLNRKAGGTSSGWNHRQTYCRVYDPRGFEFEITIPNLLYILENSNSIKGKGLEGRFIYGWDGKDLVLLPENSPEFKENINYTNLQSLKLKKSDLIVGGIYKCKDNLERTYMGNSDFYNGDGVSLGKMLWFTSPETTYRKNSFSTYNIDVPKEFIKLNENFSNLMELLQQHDGYRRDEVEYKEVDEFTLDSILPTSSGSWYSKDFYCYIKSGNKYRPISLRLYGKYSNYGHLVIIGRERFEYSSVKEILNNHKLWQVTKTTKES